MFKYGAYGPVFDPNPSDTAAPEEKVEKKEEGNSEVKHKFVVNGRITELSTEEAQALVDLGVENYINKYNIKEERRGE